MNFREKYLNFEMWMMRYIVAGVMLLYTIPANASGQIEIDWNSRAESIFNGEESGTQNPPLQSPMIELIPLNSELGNSGENLPAEFSESENILLAQAVVPTLTITNNFGDEWDSDGNMDVNVSLSSAASTNVTFKYSMEDITTTKGSDYTEKAESERTVTIDAGDTSDSFTIPVTNDALYEGNETFRITLTDLVGANFSSGTELTQIFTIRDNEGPTISFANTPLTVLENVAGGKLVATVKLSNPHHSRISFPYSIKADGSASASSSDRDFVSRNFVPLTFATGETEQTIEIDIVNDNRKEGNETFSIEFTKIFIGNFTVNFSLPDGTTSQLYSELVTIIDDESIQILADSFTIDENAGTFRGKVKLGSTPSEVFLASLEVRAGTATDGVNYSELTIVGDNQSDWRNPDGWPEYRLTFRPNTTNEFSFEIPITNNSIKEVNKTFELVLKSLNRTGGRPIGTVASFPNGQSSFSRTVTIMEDDHSHISVSNDIVDDRGDKIITFNENDSDASLDFTISPALDQNANFSFETSNGLSGTISAVSGTDFNVLNGIKRVSSGATTFSIPLELINNSDIEETETFTITLSNLENLDFTDDASSKEFIIKIVDDDIPVISVEETIAVDENVEGGKVAVVVNLSRPSTENISVIYFTSTGTGSPDTRNTDFRYKEDTLTFLPGEIKKTVEIEIINDSIPEGTETFTFTLSNITGIAIFPNDHRIDGSMITIIDDDIPKIDISADSFYVAEDEGTFNAKLVVSDTVSQAFEFTLAVSDDTAIMGAGNDYTLGTEFTNRQRLIQFNSSTTEIPISIPIVDNNDNGTTKTFTLNLSGLTITSNPTPPTVQFNNGQDTYTKTVTIVDDDSKTLTFAESELSITETTGSDSGNNFVVNLNLSSESKANVTFDFELTNDEAIKSSDFSDPASLSGTISAGSTTGTISIPIINDAIHEPDETLTITLKNLVGAKFASGDTLSQTITITDDDEPTLVIPANSTPFLVAEDSPNDQLILNLQFSKALVLPVTATLVTSNGTAIAGEDYSAVNGSTGEISSTTDKISIPIPSINDSDVESSESFSFRITELSGAKFPAGVSEYTGTITIVDDDSTTLSITSDSLSVSENASGGNHTVNFRLSRATSVPVAFDYTLNSGTATSGVDFTEPANRTVTISAGSTEESITIPIIINDSYYEVNETILFNMSNLVGANFATGQNGEEIDEVAISINDDDADAIPVLSVTNSTFSFAENDNNGSLEVSFSATLAAASSFSVERLAASGNTADAETDFEIRNNTTQTVNSVNSVLIPLDIINDTDVESSETFTIKISNLVNIKFSDNASMKSFTITIVDDDSTTLSITNTNFNIGEEIGDFVVNLSLSNATTIDVPVVFELSNSSSHSATLGTDVGNIDETNNKVVIPAGTTTGTFRIPITNDLAREGGESFIFSISVLGALIASGDSTKTIVIIDDESPKIDITASSFNIPEEHGKFSANLTIDGSFPQTFRFRLEFGITGDTAVFGSDYRERIVGSQIVSNSIVTIPFNTSTRQIPISLDIIDDAVLEEDETITLRLSNLTSTDVQFANGGISYSKTIKIADDESITVSFSNTDFSFGESETTQNESGQSVNEFVAVVGLSRSTIAPVTFRVGLVGSTASPASIGSDFRLPINRDITINPGTSEAQIRIPIINNNIHELTESFSITLTNLVGANFPVINGVPANTLTTTIEIVDDDAPFLVIPSDPVPLLVPEDGGEFNYDLTFSKALVQPIKVWIETTNGTAIKDTDFMTSATHERTNITTDTLPVPFTAKDNTETGANKTFTFRITQMEGARFPEGVTSLTGTVTIVDDESTTLTLTNTEFFVEEDVAGENFDLNLELSGVSDIDVTFTYELPRYNPDIGFPVGYDMNSINQLTIPAGETTKTISIPIVDDENVEGNERFYIIIKNLIGAEFTNESANSLQTISDTSDGKVLRQNVVILDDNSPIVSISADTYSIAEDGGQFTFKVAVADYQSGYIRYRVFAESESGDEFATEGSDFGTFSTVGFFNTTVQEREHTITILDDLLKEGEETFKISLQIDESYQGRLPKGSLTHSKTVTIYDDESTILSVKNTRLTFDEDAPTPGKFIVKLGISRTIEVDTLVDYDLESLTATKSDDFIELPASNRKAKIIPGQSGVNFEIEITNDSKHEGNETFKVILKNPVAAVFASGDTLEFIITIVDDEDPEIELTETPYSVAENVTADEIEVSVGLSGPSSRNIAINYVTADNTAEMGEDYTFKQGVLRFRPGVTEQTFTIPILDDTANEGNESFNIQFRVSIGNAVFSDGESTFTRSVTINDDEDPTLSIANTEFNVYEDVSSGKYELELYLSGARNTGNVSLDFAVNGGTATNLIDFSNTSENVVIMPGETSKIVDIGIIDDAINEGNKTIRFNLSNLTGAVFASGAISITRTITIIEDDSTTFSLTTTDFRFDENLTGGEFVVEYMLSKTRAFDVNFTVSTEDDTATKVLDYTALENHVVAIPAGQKTGSFSISILNDTLNEGVERFSFKIENVVGATIAGNADSLEKTLTIVDDEIPTLAFDQILTTGKIIEGYGRYDFQFNLNPVVNQRFTISAEFTDGTARRGHEFTTPEGGPSISKTIESASASLTLPGFSIPQNTTASGNKTFNITLRLTQNNGVNVAVFPNGTATQTITMTIVDDESLTLSFGNSQNIRVDEDAGEVVVGYSIATAISSDITFSYTLANHTANKVLDFTEPEADERSITLSAGNTSGSFSIKIIDDEVSEGVESFNINFSDITNAAFTGGNTTHTEPIRINENDLPTLTITNEDYSIAEDGGSLVVNLALSHASYRDVTYSVIYLDGYAKINTHYNRSTSDLRILAGATTGSFSIPIVDNGDISTSVEGSPSRTVRENYTFSFSLNSIRGAHFSADDLSYRNIFLARTVTILDDELPAITVTVPTTVAENVGVGEADDKKVIEVQYDIGRAVNWDVSFAYSFSGGTATKNVDYTESDNRIVTIRTGTTGGSFTIPIIDDSENEGNETFNLTLQLGSPLVSGGALRNAGASSFVGHGLVFKQTITIVDDEIPTLSLSNRDLTVSESVGAAGFVANFSLSGATDSIVSFDYELTGGTAIKGTDYTVPNPSNRRIPIGQTADSFTIPITNDRIVEGSETFNIVVNIRDLAAKFANGTNSETYTITIHDDEQPTLSFAAGQIIAVENVESEEIVVNVELNGITHQDITFNYDMTDITTTKGGDYLEDGTRVGRILAGQSTGSFTIPIADDLKNEGDETFTVTLSSPVGAIFTNEVERISKTVTIQDNELPTISLTTEDFVVAEDVGSAGFVVNFDLSGPTNQAVTFNWNLSNGTAIAGEDFTVPAQRTVTFPLGDATAKSIRILIINDGDNEGNHSFTLELSGFSGAVFESEQLVYTIMIDDDELPELSIATTNLKVFEDVGSDGFVVEFELSGPTDEDVTFDFALSGGSATKNFDYTEDAERDRRVTIAANEMTSSISIPIINDSSSESNETFNLTLSNLNNAVFAGGSAPSPAITILDDDSNILTFVNSSFEVAEDIGSSGFVVNVELTTAPELDVTFDYDLIGEREDSNYTAVEGIDYVELANKSVAISAGSRTGSFAIRILDDLETEGSQVFKLDLLNIKGAKFTSRVSSITQDITILDNESPIISIVTTNFNVSEGVGATGFELELELNKVALDDVVITPTLYDGTAIVATDFNYTTADVSARPIAIEEGETSGTVVVHIIDDTVIEQSENFGIQLRATGDGYPEFTNNISTIRKEITILDNDAPILSISDGPSVEESDAHAVFTISSVVQPANNNFRIQYTAISPSFVNNSGTKQTSDPLVFGDTPVNGFYTAQLQVPIASDALPELNSDLEVIINPDTVGSEKYFVHPTDFSATVFVRDDDAAIPELSLVDVTNPVAESAGSVDFTVIASADPERELTIYYTPAEVGQGDFLTDAVAAKTSTGVTFQTIGGEEQGTISVDLHNDLIGEPTGEISVTLNADTETHITYTVVSGATATGTATILDNDAPTLTIATGSAVTEIDSSGSPAQAVFTVSSAVQPATNNFTVQYTPTSANFAINSGTQQTSSHTLNFADADNDGIYTAELRVNIAHDEYAEVNQNLDVTLNPDTVGSEKYYVGTPASASIFVIDDDAAKPELSIEDVTNVVAESDLNVEFTIVASEDPERELTVYYTPAEVDTGDFLTDAVAADLNTSVTFQTVGDKVTGSISIPLHNDDVAEPTGMIEVTLNADSAPSQTYTVAAGDAATATATIYDDEAPELSIENGLLVSELDTITFARFTVSSAVQPVTNNFRIQYTPTSTNFVANSGTKRTSSHTLDFADDDNDGIYTAELQVEIARDTDPETNEYLQVVLNPDTVGSEKYFVKDTSNTASVFVVDNDSAIPELSLKSIPDSIVESDGRVEFTVIASENPRRDITIRYTPEEVNLGDFLSDEVAKATDETITFQKVGGLEKGTFTVDLVNDSNVESTGMIKVTLNNDPAPAQTYTVISGERSSATVTILDNDQPTVTISSTENNGFVSEGGSFTFTLTATPVPDSAFSVNLNVSELVATGHLSTLTGPNSNAIAVALDGSAEVEIGTSGSVDVVVATTNDTTNKRHGEIQISIVDGTYTDYVVTTDTSMQDVAMRIEDLIAPDITISSAKDDSSITEGESFKFLVEADIVPLTAISVKLEISDNSSGHYKSITPTAPIAIHNVGSVEVTLETNNTTSEAHSAIDVSIDATNVTTYTAATSDISISVGIEDSVKPEVSIASTQHDGILTEGGSFTFTLTADPVPYSAIMVDITAVDSGTGHLSSLTGSNSSAISVAADGAAQVEIGTGGTAQVTVATTNDTANARQGVIDISLDSVTDAAYTVVAYPEDETDTLLNAIQVKIKDTVKPVVSISTTSGKVSEGSSFTFSLSSIPEPISPITVDFNVAELVATGHLSTLTGPNSNVITVASDGSAEVEISTTGSVDVIVETTNDTTHKRHGEIKVSLDEGTFIDYAISTNTSQKTVQVKVEDQIAPDISISSSKDDSHITEGESFKFLVEADIVPLTAISVKLEISDNSSGHYKSITPTAPIAMHNVGSVEVTLATNNTNPEAHSAIDVSIDATNVTTYTATTSNTSISVGIEDSVKPEVSIASTQHDGILTEGGSFTFTLTADPAPYSAITIDFTAVDSGTSHLTSLTGSDLSTISVAADGSAQVEIGTGGTAKVTVATTNDTANVRHGVIDISIDSVTDAAYTVVANPVDETDTTLNAIQVKIKDTVKPVVSISTNSSKVSEGSSFTFSLSTTPAPIAPISVDITAVELVATGHLSTLTGPNSNVIAVASDGSAEVEIGTSGSVDITVATTNDTANKQHGEIKVSLDDGTFTDYALTTDTTQKAVQVKIEDLVVPDITISSSKDDSHITEGESFKFLVEADIVPLTAISAKLVISDNSSGHYKSITPTAPIAMHNVGSVEVTLATNNTTTEAHSSIDVSIDTTNVATYTAATSNTSITVGVVDSVKPEVSIASTQHDGVLTEGGSFTFTLTADPVPYSAIMVDITAVDSGTSHLTSLTGSNSSAISVAADGSAQVEIGTGGTAQVTVATTNDTVNVRHGVIDISIDSVTNAAYTVVADPVDETDTTLNAIQVKIQDTVKPVVSISTNSNKVSEGTSFTFSLSATPAPIVPITVDITAAELVATGHLSSLTGPDSSAISVANDGSAEVEIGMGGSVDVVVATTNDTTQKRHGEIKVSLGVGTYTDYAITTTTSQQAVQVKVEDQIAPDIIISSAKDDSHITEGESFKFLVEADIVPLTAISVKLEISDNSSGHYKSITPTAPIAMHNVGSVEVTLATNNTTTESHGSINVSIDATNVTTYTAATSNTSITVGIVDSVKPEVSIASTQHDGILTEGGSFTFTLTADPAPYSAIMVDITAVDSGTGHLSSLTGSDLSVISVAADGSAQVEIGTGGTAQVTVATANDSVNVRHGVIDISIDSVTDAAYTVVANPVDETDTTLNAIQVKIKDTVKPVVSISTNSNKVSEGTSFTFSLSASPAPIAPISVDITAAELVATGHLSSLTGPDSSAISVASDGSAEVEIGTGGSVDVVVATTNDTTHKRHGEIKVSLDDGSFTDYAISTTTSQQKVEVKIEDLIAPEISISSAKDDLSIMEGESFKFLVEADIVPLTAISVKLEIDDNSFGHYKSITPTAPIAMHNTKSVEVTLSTINTPIKVRGEIEVSIDATNVTTYSASNENNSITVAIEDSTKPRVSVSASTSKISEGGSFTFTLTATPVPVSPISVDITVAELVATGHLGSLTGPDSSVITVASDGSAEVEIGTSGTVDITVATTNDTTHKRHGEIKISLDNVTSEDVLYRFRRYFQK